jgi:hypothetical protein
MEPKSRRCLYYKVGVGVLVTLLAAVSAALSIHLYVKNSSRVGAAKFFKAIVSDLDC